jgi:hypothetical protein
MQSVGADHQLDLARVRALEADRDHVAAVVQAGDAVAEDEVDVVAQGSAQQVDQVVAQDFDVRVVDHAAGRRRFGVAGQLVAVAVHEGRAANVRLLVLGALQQTHPIKDAQGRPAHVDRLPAGPQPVVPFHHGYRIAMLFKPNTPSPSRQRLLRKREP